MVEEQRRRMAEEERNRRAAQDFSRMSLAGSGGGGQPVAPHAPQHYPPAYQVSRFVLARPGPRMLTGICFVTGLEQGVPHKSQ